MHKPIESTKSRAGLYRDRAEELRVLADQLKCEEHKRLLLKSADNYEKLARFEAKGPDEQSACRRAALWQRMDADQGLRTVTVVEFGFGVFTDYSAAAARKVGDCRGHHPSH